LFLLQLVIEGTSDNQDEKDHLPKENKEGKKNLKRLQVFLSNIHERKEILKALLLAPLKLFSTYIKVLQ